MAKLYELTKRQIHILRQGVQLLEQERRNPRSPLLPPLPESIEIIELERALQTPAVDKK